jgi:hypothetical protein
LIPGAHKSGPPSTDHVKIGMMSGSAVAAAKSAVTGLGDHPLEAAAAVRRRLVAATMSLEEGDAWILCDPRVQLLHFAGDHCRRSYRSFGMLIVRHVAARTLPI